MIALNEAVEAAAEVPFYLGTTADETVGLTGHTFTSGEVQLRLPGAGSFVNATTSKIIEKGFGRYAVRLTSAQTTAVGACYVTATVTGANFFYGYEMINVLGGDLAVAESEAFPFFLVTTASPYVPVTGNTFASGDVKVCLPNLTYANADITRISEIGSGYYAYQLNPSETAIPGKVFVHATATGALRFDGYLTILGTGSYVPPIPTPPTPTAVVSEQPGPTLLDHVSDALSRLCEYAKDKS